MRKRMRRTEFLRKKLQKNTGKVRKPLDENKKSNYDNICVLCAKVKGGRWMYMVDYEGTMPILPTPT